MEFKVADDKQRLDIRFPGTEQKLDLNAQDVEALIRILGSCRAAMLPARPSRDPAPGTPMISSQNMRWAVLSWPAAPYQVSLCLFERGIGWVSIGLDRSEALRLQQGLESRIENMSLVQ